MKCSKLPAGTMLCSALVLTLFQGAPVLAADEKGKDSAVVSENKDFKKNDADYQGTFTHKPTSKDVKEVALVGNFNFYNQKDGKKFISGEEVETILPDEQKDGMFQTGYSVNDAGYLPIPMEKQDDGTFKVTLPLPGTQYFYGFVEDGDMDNILKDQSNLPEKNGDSDCGWSTIYVGDKDNCLEGQEYIYPRTDKKVGTVEYVNYKAADGSEKPLGIYLSEGYDKNETYKTLYLSHGGGNEVEWMTIGSAKNIFDNLIAEGKLDKTIIVTMDNQELEWDMDKIDKNLTEAIIPYVEENCSVSKDKADKAFAGLSMGGYTTVSEALKSPDQFGYYGIFTPNFGCLDIMDAATEKELAKLKDVDGFYEVSGIADDGLGKQDRYKTIFGIRRYLTDHGANLAFDIKDGAHDWGLWRDALTTFAKDHLWKMEKTS